MPGVLLVAVSAAMAGCRGFTATGEWAARLTDKNLNEFALRSAPGESTLRTGTCVCTPGPAPPSPARHVIAVDGKTLPGSRSATERARHLVAGLDHMSGTVMAPPEVEAKSTEIPALPAVIKALGERAAGAVITADALHTQTASATAILAAGVDYVFTVKSNQPTLHKNLAGQP